MKLFLMSLVFLGSLWAFALYMIFVVQEFATPRTEVLAYLLAFLCPIPVLLALVAEIDLFFHRRRNRKKNQDD